jgi:CheY-like chemotaxis protein
VIICSIINDPKLALALGADAFLHKPVDRARLLQALASVLSPSA